MQVMKTIGGAVLGLTLMTQAFADFSPAPYLGASIGIVTNSLKALGLYRGAPVQLIAGYGGVIGSRFYLAGELNATLATMDIVNYGSVVKSTDSYALSVIPGFLLNDQTLGYLRFGVARTWFENPSEAAYGARAGLGLATQLTPSWQVRVEYHYTAYEQVNRYGMDRNPRTDEGDIAFIYRFA